MKEVGSNLTVANFLDVDTFCGHENQKLEVVNSKAICGELGNGRFFELVKKKKKKKTTEVIAKTIED